MFKDFLSKGKVFKIYKVFLSSWQGDQQLQHKLMEPSMKSEISSDLLEWGIRKNLEIQAKSSSKTLPMMHQVGSKNFKKTKPEENDQQINLRHTKEWYFSLYFYLNIFEECLMNKRR